MITRADTRPGRRAGGSGFDLALKPLTRRSLLAAPAFLAACGRPKGTGFPGYLFVANQAGRSVTAVDLTGFRAVRHLGLSAAPAAILAHPHRESVYVLTPSTGAVHEIDARKVTLVRSLPVGASAVSMRMGPEGDVLWVLCREPTMLVRVALDRFVPSGRIRLPAIPTDFDIAWQDARAAVCLGERPGLVTIGLASGRVERSIGLPAEPRLARFRSDGRIVLVAARGDHAITVLETQTGHTIVRLPLAIEPLNFCFTPDGGQLFMTGTGRAAVAIVFPYRTEVAETLLAGKSPGAMAVSSSPGLLLVANPESSGVAVFEIASRRLLAVVSVGAEPGSILITPDSQYALVLNQRSGDVAVIRLAAVIDRRLKMAPLFTMIPVGSKPVSAAVRRL